MKYRIYSFRHAVEIFQANDSFTKDWIEICGILDSISDVDLINEFNSESRKAKSLSEAINKLIDRRMKINGWNAQSHIFADSRYSDKKGTWRLDFAKNNIAVEVAFNHGGNVSCNLLKPVLSSELNHVKKAIQTQAGVIITATDSMKKAGGFDSAVGSYEKYVEYLKPLNNILTVPLLIIGLEKPDSFVVKHYNDGNKKIGYIVMKNEDKSKIEEN